MKQKMIDAFLIAVAIIGIAVVIAAGSRLVVWLAGESNVASVWKLTLALIGGAGVAGISGANLRNGGNGK